jgi:hypothetical protein
MIQQWLLRAAGDDGDGTDLLAKNNAYLLSSTYGINSGTTEMLMALNIHNGKIEALSADAFTASTVYVLKVKEEEPTWQVYKNYRRNGCIATNGGIGTIVGGADCSNVNEQKWYYELNSGYLRSRDSETSKSAGSCLWALTERGNGNNSSNNMMLGDCETYSYTPPAGLLINGARWTRTFIRDISNKPAYTFGTSGSTGWHIFEETNAGRDIEMYDYTSGPNINVTSDRDAIWILQ